MDRRGFLRNASVLLSAATLPAWAHAAPPRLLVLIELRGGNDGLNSVVPVEDGLYFDLRPRLALKPDVVLRWHGAPALHPSLATLEPLWQAGEMAILAGVGYPAPNLSHFRSIEIWDTASDSHQYLQSGWLSRAVQGQAAFARLSADGVVIGAAGLGPLAGGASEVAVNDPARFARQSRLASMENVPARGAMAHLLRVEGDIVRAGAAIRPDVSFKTEFPRGPVGIAVQHAAGIAATGSVPVLRLTLPGFDTHQNQSPVHDAAATFRGGRCGAAVGADRTGGVGPNSRAELFGIRTAPAGEPERRNRPWHRRHIVRIRAGRAWRHPRRIAFTALAGCRRQPAVHD